MSKVIHSVEGNNEVNLSDPFLVKKVQQDRQQEKQQQALQALEQQKQREKEEAAYQKAYALGIKKAEECYQQKLQQVNQLAQQLETALQQQIKGVEEIAVSISLELLKRFLIDARNNKNRLHEIIQAMLSQFQHRQTLLFHVSPRDYEALMAEPNFMKEWQTKFGVQIISDSTVHLGGCILETEVGDYDARFEQQLESIREVLLHESLS